jgi:hypothetical protein
MGKIALCLTGYPASVSKIEDVQLKEDDQIIDMSYGQLDKHILQNNDIDIFIHTWDSASTRKYLETFQPLDYLVEKQPDFVLDDYNPIFKDRKTQQSIYARSYAISKVIDLCLRSKNEYSHVLLTRPDIYWLRDIKLSSLLAEFVHISDWKNFYDKKWQKIPETDLYKLLLDEDPFIKIRFRRKGWPLTTAIHDIIFLMNMKNLMLFKDIFNNIENCIKTCDHLMLDLIYVNREPHKLNAHYFFYLHAYLCKFTTGILKDTFEHCNDYTLTRHALKAKQIEEGINV